MTPDDTADSSMFLQDYRRRPWRVRPLGSDDDYRRVHPHSIERRCALLRLTRPALRPVSCAPMGPGRAPMLRRGSSLALVARPVAGAEPPPPGRGRRVGGAAAAARGRASRRERRGATAAAGAAGARARAPAAASAPRTRRRCRLRTGRSGHAAADKGQAARRRARRSMRARPRSGTRSSTTIPIARCRSSSRSPPTNRSRRSPSPQRTGGAGSSPRTSATSTASRKRSAITGATAKLVRLDVPDDRARWVEPNEESNKLGYYRVYGTRLVYEVDGKERSFDVTSLISWRGEWYVVHLTGFK